MASNNFTGGGGSSGDSTDDGGDDTTEAETTEVEEQSSIDSGTSSTTTFTSGDTSGTSYSFDDSGGSDTGGSGGTSEDTQFTSGTGSTSTSSTSTSSTSTTSTSGSDSGSPDTTQTDVERESSEGGGTSGSATFDNRGGTDLSGQTGARDAAEDLTGTTLQEGVEGSAGDPRYRDQARELEGRAVDRFDWARDESDVAVTEEDGQLVARPSRSAEVRHRESALLEGAREMTSPSQDGRGSGPTGASYDPGAGRSLPVVSVTSAEPGDVRFEVDEGDDVTVRLAENETEEQLRRNTSRRHGVDPEDVVITERKEDGRTVVEARPSREALRRKAEERVEEQFGTDFDPDEDLEFEERPGGGFGVSLTTSGRAKAEQATEVLGDADALVGREAEEFLREQSLAHQDRVTEMGDRLSGELEEHGVPGPLSRRQAGAATGVFRFLDPAGLALTAEEVGEYAHEAVDRGPEGADELAIATAGVAAEGARDFVSTWEESPHSTTGELAGGLIASTAIMGGAAAVSGRSGVAARLAIQPGEEIAGQAGHAVTRTAAGARAADRLFPDKEPLVFSEEFAIRATKTAGAKASRAGRATLTVAKGEAELPPSPRQQDLIDTARREGPTDVQGEGSGHYAGPSEPLGADTEAALDATLGPPAESELERQAERDEAAAEREAQRAEEEYWQFRTEAERAKRPPEGASLDEIAQRVEEEHQLHGPAREANITVDLREMTGGGLDMEAQQRGRAAVDEALERHRQAGELEVRAERKRELEAHREQVSDFGGHELGYDTESGAKGRLEAAQRSEVRAESESELAWKTEPAGAPLPIGAENVGYRSLGAETPLLSVRLDTELDRLPGQELEAEQEGELEMRSEAEVARELEAEAESEWEFGREAEAEAERAGQKQPEKEREQEDYAMLPGYGASADDEASLGWVGESIGAFAGVNLGAAASRTPESELEDADHPFGEAVPRLTEDEREAFDSALDFFGLDNTEGDWL